MVATIFAVVAAVAAVAAALKALPVIWSAFKHIGKFFAGMEKVEMLPELSRAFPLLEIIEKKVDGIGQELREHMAEEERMRSEEKALVEDLAASVREYVNAADRQTLEVAEAVFKQATFNDEVAYYIVDRDMVSHQWLWRWGNPAYMRLTGLTESQAKSGQYRDIVSVQDRDRVFNAAEYAGEAGVALEVDFVNVNVSTGEETSVRVVAAPLKDREEVVAAYLGSIRKL